MSHENEDCISGLVLLLQGIRNLIQSQICLSNFVPTGIYDLIAALVASKALTTAKHIMGVTA